MKRTTYIIFGMMLAGLLAMSGIIFYVSLHTTEWEETFMEIKGERQTVVLPPCKVVKLTQPQEKVILESRGERVSTYRIVSFRKVVLDVSPADSLQGSFSFAGDMASFMSVTAAGDTAFITFDIPAEKVEKRFQDTNWLKIKSEEMRLSIPDDVQAVLVDVYGLETNFRDFGRDTLSFKVRDRAGVENCRIASLSAQAHTLLLNSGEVRNLHLNLDGTADWKVDVDSFHIDTEHLTGSRRYRSVLQRGECRRVLWTPKSKEASLDVVLNQSARIEVD